MREYDKNNKNAGFSLIELIIVVAIMAVLMGVLVVNLFVVNKSSLRSNALTFDRVLSTTQSSTMGRVDTFDMYYTFDMSKHEGYVQVGVGGEKHKISDQKMPMYIWNGSSYSSSTCKLRFVFSKSSGALKGVYFTVLNMNDAGGMDDVTDMIGSGLPEYKFLFGSETGTHYTVHIIAATGKHYID